MPTLAPYQKLVYFIAVYCLHEQHAETKPHISNRCRKNPHVTHEYRFLYMKTVKTPLANTKILGK